MLFDSIDLLALFGVYAGIISRKLNSKQVFEKNNYTIFLGSGGSRY